MEHLSFCQPLTYEIYNMMLYCKFVNKVMYIIKMCHFIQNTAEHSYKNSLHIALL